MTAVLCSFAATIWLYLYKKSWAGKNNSLLLVNFFSTILIALLHITIIIINNILYKDISNPGFTVNTDSTFGLSIGVIIIFIIIVLLVASEFLLFSYIWCSQKKTSVILVL